MGCIEFATADYVLFDEGFNDFPHLRRRQSWPLFMQGVGLVQSAADCAFRFGPPR
jgi:hypothetical protein